MARQAYMCYAVALYRVMSRNAIGPGNNGKVPRDSVVVLEESLVNEGKLTSPRPRTLSCWEFSRTCILQTQYDNYDYDAPNRDEGAKKLFDYESDRRSNLLICMNYLRN